MPLRLLLAVLAFAAVPFAAEADRADISLVTGARGQLDRLVESAIAQGADVDTRDGNGRTALSWAAQHGNVDMMRLLLANGADIALADKGGRTPLMWAAIVNRKEAAAFLLRQGADPTATDDEGRTAAELAEEGGNDPTLVGMLRQAAER